MFLRLHVMLFLHCTPQCLIESRFFWCFLNKNTIFSFLCQTLVTVWSHKHFEKKSNRLWGNFTRAFHSCDFLATDLASFFCFFFCCSRCGKEMFSCRCPVWHATLQQLKFRDTPPLCEGLYRFHYVHQICRRKSNPDQNQSWLSRRNRETSKSLQ